MGGDVLWALCNEGASDPLQLGDYKHRMDWEPDGDWRLPTSSEFDQLELPSSHHKCQEKDNTKYLVITGNYTGNSILLPVLKTETGTYCCQNLSRWDNNPNHDVNATLYFYSHSYDRLRTVVTIDYNNAWWGYARYVIPKNPNPMTGIQLDVHSLKFTRSGDKYDLNATILPSDATNTELRWSTDNPDVADVDILGRVTSKHPGTCNITVSSAANSNVFAKCEVSVEY